MFMILYNITMCIFCAILLFPYAYLIGEIIFEPLLSAISDNSFREYYLNHVETVRLYMSIPWTGVVIHLIGCIYFSLWSIISHLYYGNLDTESARMCRDINAI